MHMLRRREAGGKFSFKAGRAQAEPCMLREDEDIERVGAHVTVGGAAKRFCASEERGCMRASRGV